MTSAAEARALTDTYLQWTRQPKGRTHPKMVLLYQHIREQALHGFSNVVTVDWDLSAEEQAELVQQGYDLRPIEGKVSRVDW